MLFASCFWNWELREQNILVMQRSFLGDEKGKSEMNITCRSLNTAQHFGPFPWRAFSPFALLSDFIVRCSAAAAAYSLVISIPFDPLNSREDGKNCWEIDIKVRQIECSMMLLASSFFYMIFSILLLVSLHHVGDFRNENAVFFLLLLLTTHDEFHFNGE